MADEDQEREFDQRQQAKWRTRPESTIAQNFATDLDAMFGLTPAVEDLSKTIEQKKQTVSSGTQQLQELEARLRATEQRLARASKKDTPLGASELPDARTDTDHTATGALRQVPLAQRPSSNSSRPPTAGERPISNRENNQTMVAGTPQHQMNASEYVMVDRSAGQAQRGYA